MTREHFHMAIALAANYDQMVTIGGGEPTLHPLFKEFMQHAEWELAHVTSEHGMPAVGVITNGTHTELSLQLAKLASLGVISARVSKDQYHDASMVDPKVYAAFVPRKDTYGHQREDDCRGINDGNGYIQPVGRAKSWGYHPLRTCVCDSVFITPKGYVFPCGCKKKALGHLDDPNNIPIVYEHFEGYCQSDTEKYAEHVESVMKENGLVTA